MFKLLMTDRSKSAAWSWHYLPMCFPRAVLKSFTWRLQLLSQFLLPAHFRQSPPLLFIKLSAHTEREHFAFNIASTSLPGQVVWWVRRVCFSLLPCERRLKHTVRLSDRPTAALPSPCVCEWVSECMGETSSRFPCRHTNPPANHVQCHSTT